jgi:hypothetical protein
MKQAFLTGYTGKPTRTPAQLLQLAINLEAIVVDSRYSPRSRVQHWNRDWLRFALQDRYRWLQDFGNEAYKLGTIRLSNPNGGIFRLDALGVSRAIVLCACADGETCHRKQVGEYLAANGWEVREVTAQDWKDAR